MSDTLNIREDVLSIQPSESTIEHCLKHGLELGRVAFDSPTFEQILTLRAEAYGRTEAAEPEEYDRYSEHYCAWQHDELVGALRVTRASQGRIESETHFPKWVLDNYRDSIGSASRFASVPGLSPSLRVAQLLVETAWTDQLPREIRLDVIKCRFGAVPYYLRLGYFFMKSSMFTFDRWSEPCVVMVYPANPSHESKISHVFGEMSQPFGMQMFADRDLFLSDYREVKQELKRLAV